MTKRQRSTRITSDLRTGAAVITDTGMTGTITEILPDFPDAEGGVRVAWEGAQSTVVPRRALNIERDRILVRTDGEATGAEAQTAERAGVEGEDLVVPVIEERLTTDTRWRDAGSVTFHLRTEAVPETVEEYVTREELEVEEVVVGRLLATGEVPTQRQEGDTLIIPIIEERLVTVKEHVLVKEVHISRRSRTESRAVTETVRRQHVEVDGGDVADRVRMRGIIPAKEATEVE